MQCAMCGVRPRKPAKKRETEKNVPVRPLGGATSRRLATHAVHDTSRPFENLHSEFDVVGAIVLFFLVPPYVFKIHRSNMVVSSHREEEALIQHAVVPTFVAEHTVFILSNVQTVVTRSGPA